MTMRSLDKGLEGIHARIDNLSFIAMRAAVTGFVRITRLLEQLTQLGPMPPMVYFPCGFASGGRRVRRRSVSGHALLLRIAAITSHNGGADTA